MNHIEWEETNTNGPGPVTYYGYWEGAKCFSIYYGSHSKGYNGPPYVLKSTLPGFRPDLPYQPNVATAKDFAERMLQRWAAKRGLLFKNHMVITDAMKNAGMSAVQHTETGEYISADQVEEIIRAALAAREPHAATVGARK